MPVPHYLGHCGLFLMQEYGGRTMNSFYKAPIRTRLQIAKNLLLAALKLTDGYLGFRIYLTDATGDNIAVDDQTLAVTIVDLDDVIIQQEGLFAVDNKEAVETHRHLRIECDNCFAYSTKDICSCPISDINLYTISQLLLEDLRGNPEGGFLYDRMQGSDSVEIQRRLRQCVYCDNGPNCEDRFQLVRDLIKFISGILEK